MAQDITNQDAVDFCNSKLRPACDRFISALRTLRQLDAEWVADGIAPLVAGSQDLLDGTVIDGSAQDGRNSLTGYDVNLAASATQAFLTWADGAGAAYVAALTKPSVNTNPVF